MHCMYCMSILSYFNYFHVGMPCAPVLAYPESTDTTSNRAQRWVQVAAVRPHFALLERVETKTLNFRLIGA